MQFIINLYDKIKVFLIFLKALLKIKLLKKSVEGASYRYLVEACASLGPGLSAKFIQILNSKNHLCKAHLEHLILPKEWSLIFIAQENPLLSKKISALSETGIPGSLGQVHKAVIEKDPLAIKIQYPNILNRINEQLSTFFVLSNFAKKIKLKNFNAQEYYDLFKNKLTQELDYKNELKEQEFFFAKAQELKLDVVVPKIYKEYCTQKLLVQEWLDYDPIDKLEHLNAAEKKLLAHQLFKFFSYFFIIHKKVHGDFHYGNLGVTKTNPHKLVLLDFGCILNLQENHVHVLIETIVKIRQKIDIHALSVFEKLGFNVEYLKACEKSLTNVLHVFLKPFISQDVFNFSTWNFQEEIAETLGEHRMMFRLAGPPWFLLLMRTFSGLSSCIRFLSDTINTNDLLEDLTTQSIKNTNTFIEQNMDTQKQEARHFLCIRVTENNIEKVFIEMPATAVENLEDLIPDDVLKQLTHLNYDLTKIKQKILANGLTPQVIFNAKINTKEIFVWIR